jgi:hypothetical protein
MTGPVESDHPMSEEAREGQPDPGDRAREEAASSTDATYRRTDDDSGPAAEKSE